MKRRRSSVRWAGVALVGLLAASCGEAGPDAGPGALQVTLRSPNGDEGAARLILVGPGMEGVTARAGRVFAEQRGDTLHLVVIRDDAGELGLLLQVADTTRPPVGVVVEVAGPDDRVRGLTGYSVEVRP